jgi:hypothetical protein
LAARERVANAIKRAQAAAEAECGRKLCVLHTDNGDEFMTAEFASYCADEGVQHHYSAPYNPQQNDIVERHNQTVVGMARALLKQRGIPAVFWGEVCRSYHCRRGGSWTGCRHMPQTPEGVPRPTVGSMPQSPEGVLEDVLEESEEEPEMVPVLDPPPPLSFTHTPLSFTQSLPLCFG